jgi:hypothetical protein
MKESKSTPAWVYNLVTTVGIFSGLGCMCVYERGQWPVVIGGLALAYGVVSLAARWLSGDFKR